MLHRILFATKCYISRNIFGKNEYKPNFKHLSTALLKIEQDLNIQPDYDHIYQIELLGRKIKTFNTFPSSEATVVAESCNKLLDKSINNICKETKLPEASVRLLVSHQSNFLGWKVKFDLVWKYVSAIIYMIFFVLTPTHSFILFAIKCYFLYIAFQTIRN